LTLKKPARFPGYAPYPGKNPEIRSAAAYLGSVLRISFDEYLEAFLFAGLLCVGAALMELLIGTGGQRAQAEQVALPAE
jgi:hypothetical protein